MHLLVDAGDARQHRRSHLEQRVRRSQRVWEERGRISDVGPGQVHQPSEVVCERQVEEHHVARERQFLDPVDDGDHLVVVAVADHARLGRPGRPRRVDVGEQVVLLDARRGFEHGVRVLARVGAAALAQAVELRERVQMREPERFDLPSLVLVLAERADRLRVSDDEPGIGRGAVRIDRGADRADQGKREVEKRPLERGLREDRECVAFAHAGREQTVRELVDRSRGLLPRDFDPRSIALDQIRGRRAVLCDRVEPEPANRATLKHTALGLHRRRLRHRCEA